MKAYVINLKESRERKSYMERLLTPYRDFLDITFVEAVNGKELTNEQLCDIWDQKATFKIYGRYMQGCEIGCALSHRKCCESLLESNERVALVVEDDLVLQDVDVKKIVADVEKFMCTVKPMIVLLSGDYWFLGKKQITNEVCLANIREAVCTQAYLINRNAAKIVLSIERKYLADDWFNLKRYGIKLLGVFPHIADQNRRDFRTEISTAYVGTVRKNLSFVDQLQSYYRAIIKRILVYIGHFESKKFVE